MRAGNVRKRLTIAAITAILVLCFMALSGCGELWFKDKQSESPDYHPSDADQTQYASFVLELRMPNGEQQTEEWDSFPHSKLDGDIIESWEIPYFGNTVYESVKKFFAERSDSITFRAEQHKFYMFHECVLQDGTRYNLETAYVAVDGKYSSCANYQTLFGADGIAGTDDDVKLVIIVYNGWLN